MLGARRSYSSFVYVCLKPYFKDGGVYQYQHHLRKCISLENTRSRFRITKLDFAKKKLWLDLGHKDGCAP